MRSSVMSTTTWPASTVVPPVSVCPRGSPGRHPGDMPRMTVLQTPRLRVTTWCSTDLDDLATLRADPEVMRYVGDGRPESRAGAGLRLRRYLAEQDDPGWTKWRVEDRSGTMVGRAGFGPADAGDGRELGHTLARRVWGRGLATDLARALVAWHRAHPVDGMLVAFARVENEASQRVLAKAGFARTGIRDHNACPHVYVELAG
jgi:[ribosomal protein S5]-alanine N-acetyltransferase